MSEWITDRRPTVDDAYYVKSTGGIVWITNGHDLEVALYHDVVFGTPWMPITAPEPYVKQKRFEVILRISDYAIVETSIGKKWATAPSREAAERIAEIYEEVMP